MHTNLTLTVSLIHNHIICQLIIYISYPKLANNQREGNHNKSLTMACDSTTFERLCLARDLPTPPWRQAVGWHSVCTDANPANGALPSGFPYLVNKTS